MLHLAITTPVSGFQIRKVKVEARRARLLVLDLDLRLIVGDFNGEMVGRRCMNFDAYERMALFHDKSLGRRERYAH